MKMNGENRMRSDRKTALRLTTIYSLHLTAFCVFYNFFSMYLLDLGYTAAQAGTVLSLCSFVSMLAQPVWGGLADRQGTQKKLITAMYMLGGIAVFLMQFFSERYPVLLALGLFFAATELSTPPLLNAMTLQAAEGTRVSYGTVRGVSSFVYSCFALICGNLAARLGYTATFSVHTACMILLALLIAKLYVPAAQPAERERASAKNHWGMLLKNTDFMLLMAAAFFIFAGYCVSMDLLSVILVSRGGAVSSLGTALFLCGSLEALFTLLSRRLTEWFPIRRVLAVSMAFFAVKMTALLLSVNVWGAMAALLLQGACLGVYYPVAVRYIDRIVAPECRNLAQGLHAAITYGASSMAGNFIGGRIATACGVNAMIAFGVAMCAVGALIFAFPAALRRR